MTTKQGFPSADTIIQKLRLANETGLPDKDAALLVVAFVSCYSPLDLTVDTLAAGMFMLAGRRVTAERAEMLIEELASDMTIETY